MRRLIPDAPEVIHAHVVVFLDENCRDHLRKYVVRPPKTWETSSPLDGSPVPVRVFYSRDGDGKIWFIANHGCDVTGQGTANCVLNCIDNVEDLVSMLAHEETHPGTRALYAMWLDSGLRKALLNA